MARSCCSAVEPVRISVRVRSTCVEPSANVWYPVTLANRSPVGYWRTNLTSLIASAGTERATITPSAVTI